MQPLPSLASLVLAAMFAVASVNVRAQTPEPAKTPPQKLGSMVIDWEKVPVKPTKMGERRELFDGSTPTLTNLESHVTTLNPGESPHTPHRHPEEEMIIVKAGTIEVTINGQSQRAGTGSVFFFASNDLHGMKNVGATPATYFVFRFITALTPKPSPAPAPATTAK